MFATRKMVHTAIASTLLVGLICPTMPARAAGATTTTTTPTSASTPAGTLRTISLAGLPLYNGTGGFGIYTNQTNGVVTFSTTSGASGTIVIGGTGQ
jgi:hypothetical protein